MSLRSLQALCLVNFFMADVRDGLGPFLGIFLTEHHWQTDSIGWMMTLGGVAGLLATMPSGLVADASRHKRAILVTCGLLITAATLLLWVFPTLYIVGFSQLVTGVSAAFIAPVLTGITLGLTGSSGFNHQMGRNEAFNHGGNMSAAILAGVLVFYLGTDAVFILMTGMAICATMAVFAIRNDDIDNRVARGLSGSADPAALPKLSVILAHPAVITIGVTLLLFHLANAALLPMLSMRVASAPGGEISAGVYAAATVVISQLVMIPVALFAAARAEKYGYPLLIAAALIVLPLRAALACTSADPLFMIPVQIMVAWRQAFWVWRFRVISSSCWKAAGIPMPGKALSCCYRGRARHSVRAWRAVLRQNIPTAWLLPCWGQLRYWRCLSGPCAAFFMEPTRSGDLIEAARKGKNNEQGSEMILTTMPGLIIRRFHRKDAAAFYAYMASPRVPCFYDEKVSTLAEAEEDVAKRASDETQFAVCLKESDALVGHLFADNHGEPDPHTWSIGWHFNPQYEGRGFATASVSALFTYLFTQNEARRLYAYVEDYNLPSQKLCARLHMRQEGCFKEFVSFTDEEGEERYDSTYVYALLKKEWQATF